MYILLCYLSFYYKYAAKSADMFQLHLIIFRIAANIRSNLMTSTNSTSKTPPNPVSMYLFAKAMKDASEDITEFSKLIENNTINYLEGMYKESVESIRNS